MQAVLSAQYVSIRHGATLLGHEDEYDKPMLTSDHNFP